MHYVEKHHSVIVFAIAIQARIDFIIAFSSTFLTNAVNEPIPRFAYVHPSFAFERCCEFL